MLPGDDITTVPRCGPATAKKLRANGINTVTQLLEFTGSIPGITMSQLKSAARQKLTPTISITEHSWYERNGHVIRAKSRVSRCIIGPLTITPVGCYLLVKWKVGKGYKQRAVTPVSIMTAHLFWLSNDIVSSDDEDNENPQEPVQNVLPKLQVTCESKEIQSLLPSQVQALNKLIKEVNQMRLCMLG